MTSSAAALPAVWRAHPALAPRRASEDVEREFYVEPTALKCMIDPEEIAAAALYLASDEARSITGETISVTAGFRL